MLTQLKIRNYRGFQDLTMDSLKAINLLAGKNNTGKTSLLEAVFLLSGGGDPEMALNTNVLRGLEVGKKSTVVIEPFWKRFFFGLNMEDPIVIEGSHASHGQLTLEIGPERQSTIQIPLDIAKISIATNQMNVPSLSFQFNGTKSFLKVKRGDVEINHTPITIPFTAAILLSGKKGNLEESHRLGELRQKKQGDVVLEALQIIEPKLKSIEENSSSGEPMIWGDIGLSELVPLAAMGEGMNRIARIVLMIASTPKGSVVLVDEIENGLHHSILPDVWRYIDKLAQKFDTQIIATTHSYECIEAAHESLNAERFSLHRLENTPEKTNRCVTIKPNGVRSLIHHNLEVR